MLDLRTWFAGDNGRRRKALTAVLCNYNQAATLEQSLRAFLEQTRRPDRVIVWDDCSTDGSARIIEETCKGHSWVEQIRNKKNVGHIFNCAMALQTCQTDYIYFGASDDLVYGDFFAEAMSLLEEHPQAGMFCSNYAFHDLRSNSVTNYSLPFGGKSRYLSPAELRAIVGEQSAFAFPSHTAILNVAELLRAGGFIPGLDARVDWFYQLVVSFRGGVAFSPRATARYTIGRGESFSDGHLSNSERDFACLSKMLDLLCTPRYEDVRDAFFIRAILEGSPRMLPRVAKLIHDQHQYATFRKFPAIREAVDALA